MKKLKLFLFILVSLFWLSECREKEKYSEYKIVSKTNPGTLDCYFVARCKDKPEIKFYYPCEKYKVGDVFKVEF